MLSIFSFSMAVLMSPRFVPGGTLKVRLFAFQSAILARPRAAMNWLEKYKCKGSFLKLSQFTDVL